MGRKVAARDRDWRRRRLSTARLYVCADRRGEHGDLPRFLDAVLGGGVDIVQLRDKVAGRDEVAAAAAVYRDAARRHGALFVLNDDPELAAEVDADGVHVGQDDAPPEEARQAAGRQRLVGLSTHDVAQIDRALTQDCDYFAVGPVHATPTKPGRSGIGLRPVRHAARVADRPWFVTGDMSSTTAPAALRAGARGLVVVRAVTTATDPGAVAAAMASLLGEIGQQRGDLGADHGSV